MPVRAITIKNRAPFADGRSFGDGGRYERIDATVHYAFDPESPKNRRIVDLERIPRNDDGLVTTSGNLVVIAPVERPPSCLLVEVPESRKLNQRENPEPLPDGRCHARPVQSRRWTAVPATGWRLPPLDGSRGLDTGLRLDNRYPIWRIRSPVWRCHSPVSAKPRCRTPSSRSVRHGLQRAAA